jgi:uncharacterized alkaline shock family protein YloU
MTEVAYNAPQYGYGQGGQPPLPQPPLPQPPLPQPAGTEEQQPAGPAEPTTPAPNLADAEPDTGDHAVPVASYDVDPAYEHCPPATGSPASSGRVAVQVVDRLRSTAERGSTTVPTAVIEKIAVREIREVPGVYDFGAGEKPITIGLDGRTATVEIRVVVEYGFGVYPVTEKVRTKVISALENLFGLDVTSVDIVVDDIHVEEPDEN